MLIENTKRFWNRLFENENTKIRCIFTTAFALSIISYYLLIITGLTCPDGICEGLTFYNYSSEDWASRNGRWAIRYLNKLSGNVVIPMFVVLAYCFCICCVVYLLLDCFKINKRISIISMTAIMVTSPCMIAHFLYTYMALAYGVSCLLSTFFVWIIYTQKGKWKYFPACISLCISLGMYQSYIGLSMLLILLLFITDAIKRVSWKAIVKQAFEYFINGFLGCLLYLVISKLDLKIRNLSPASRVSSFDLKQVLFSLPLSVKSAYEKLFLYFHDEMFHRNRLYLLLFAVAVLFIGMEVISLIKQRKYINIFIIIILIPLLPVAANFVGLIIPSFEIYLLMQYQYILVIPFSIWIIEYVGSKNKVMNAMRAGLYLIVLVISWTYVVSANATYICYRLSYNHINFETSLILEDIYELPGFMPSESKIIFAGFPEAEILHENIGTYKYAIYYVGNPVFWRDMHGANGNRYWYLMNYFGIDGGYFTDDEYISIINSDEFKDMSVWPCDNSIKMIQGNAVVKFTDDPSSP